MGESFTRRTVLAATMAVGTLPLIPAYAGISGSTQFREAEAIAEQLISGRKSPGLTVAVGKGGKIVYSRGFGMANLETNTALAANGVVQIGSITKHFAAAAILRLEEAGKLKLEDRLDRFFPNFPRAADITLHQMLTHTSGLSSYTNDDFLQSSRLDYTEAQMIERFEKTDPLYLFEPGTSWIYSDTAYFLLGLIIEKVAGEPLPKYLKREVITRAGLAHTAIDDAADVVPHRVSGYSPSPDAPSGFANASFVSLTYAGGAGALRSTPEDLCRWYYALMNGKVVSAASLAKMLTPVRLLDGRYPPRRKDHPFNHGGDDVLYGYGLDLASYEGRKCISHTGYIQGFLSGFYGFPENDVVIAYTANCDGAAVDLAGGIGGLRGSLFKAFV